MDRRLSIALALIACAAVAGCGAPADSSARPVKPPEVVLYARPVMRTVTDHEEFPGRTDAVMSVQVTSRVSGYMNQVYFQDGQQVEKGDVLFQIDPREFQAELDRAKAANQQAEAHAKRLNNEFQRAKVLYDRGMSISREEYDRYNFDSAEAAAAVGTAKANYDLAALNFEFTRVVAPISGRLGRRLVDPGNLVKADETPLITIVSQDPIYVYFDVHEQAMLKIRRLIQEGKVEARSEHEVPVQLSLADEHDFPHRGVVDFTDNRVDLSTGTLRFRAAAREPRRAFHPGAVRPRQAADRRPSPGDHGSRGGDHVGPGREEGERGSSVNEGRQAGVLRGREGQADPRPRRRADPQVRPRDGQRGDARRARRRLPRGERGGHPDDLVVVTGLQKLRKDAPVSAREFDLDRDGLASSEPVKTTAKAVAAATGGGRREARRTPPPSQQADGAASPTR